MLARVAAEIAVLLLADAAVLDLHPSALVVQITLDSLAHLAARQPSRRVVWLTRLPPRLASSALEKSLSGLAVCLVRRAGRRRG